MNSTSRAERQGRPSSPLRFIGLFALLATVGFSIEIIPWVDAHVVEPFTHGIAALSAWVVRLFGGAAQAEGRVMRHAISGFAILIANGCTGLEAIILVAAAVGAYPASWRQKAWGLLWGAVGISVLNLGRVISLFYLGQYRRDWFDWAHLYAWDVLIILDGALVFLWWASRLPRRAAPSTRHST